MKYCVNAVCFSAGAGPGGGAAREEGEAELIAGENLANSPEFLQTRQAGEILLQRARAGLHFTYAGDILLVRS